MQNAVHVSCWHSFYFFASTLSAFCLFKWLQFNKTVSGLVWKMIICAVLRIWYVYPSSRIPIFPSRNPDLGSRVKNIPDPKSRTQKIIYKLSEIWSGILSRIRILISYPSRIPIPGSKKTPDPGSATLTLRIPTLLVFLQLWTRNFSLT